MMTDETLMPNAEVSQFCTPSETVKRKEQELSALLARVLAAPFDPVLDELSRLSSGTKHSGAKLADLTDELSSVDGNIEKLIRIAKTNALKLEAFDKALSDIAKVALHSEVAAAERGAQFEEALSALREETQQARVTAARNMRTLLILFAILLASIVGHITFETLG